MRDVERERQTELSESVILAVCLLTGLNTVLCSWQIGVCVPRHVYMCVCVSSAVFVSHRYYMYPEAAEKMKQMDSMEPAPALTTHQLLHTVELAHDQHEHNQAAVIAVSTNLLLSLARYALEVLDTCFKVTQLVSGGKHKF